MDDRAAVGPHALQGALCQDAGALDRAAAPHHETTIRPLDSGPPTGSQEGH